VAPRTEGALAAVPRVVTPPPRDKDRQEPLRDIPGLRKRERTWRDEVKERVRSRRQKRAQAGLPLFEQPEVADSPEPAAPPIEEPVSAPEPAPSRPSPPEMSAHTAPVAPAPTQTAPVGRRAPAEPPDGAAPELVATPLSEEELADLPLHPRESLADARAVLEGYAAEERERGGLEDDLDLSEEAVASEDEDEVSLHPSPMAPEPLERPARPGERALSAAVDAGLLTVLGALVLYFTGRAARADLTTLLQGWPWLVAYLAFLGLFYAGYFTGTTGQTPGKMITGLRVVDSSGRPPGYVRAVLRAAAGAFGTALAGLGLLTMAFDPARRAVHDRLLQTRVVHR